MTCPSSKRWEWAFPILLSGWSCSNGLESTARAVRYPSRRRRSRGWRERKPEAPSREYDLFLGRGGSYERVQEGFSRDAGSLLRPLRSARAGREPVLGADRSHRARDRCRNRTPREPEIGRASCRERREYRG